MAKRIVIISHETPKKDDRASAHLARRGFEILWKTPVDGDRLGDTGGDVAGTIVLGGKYPVREIPERSFMRHEMRWIGAMMGAGLPVLGICQGAQMIAHALGAAVGPHPEGWHEFGRYLVEPTPKGRDFLPRPVYMVEAHFHQFAIPDSAVRLAKSALFANQAFRWGDRVYGLQFHPEVTAAGYRRWRESDWWRAAADRPGVQTAREQDRDGAARDGAMDEWFCGFLDRLFGAAP